MAYNVIPFEWSVGIIYQLNDIPKTCIVLSYIRIEFAILVYGLVRKKSNTELLLLKQLFEYDGLIKAIIQPSAKVQKIIDNTIKRNFVSKANTRLVSLVVRTGQGEYNQFLSIGDEMNFVKCLQAYVKSTKGQAVNKFRVFVTSDVDDVKQKVVRALRGDEAVEVVTLNESNVHVMHLNKQELKTQEVRDKLRRTYAEFFLIAKCEVHFLTHGSLFGRTASEHGGAREGDIHFISDSQCDGHREKYSYLQCHKPKYPKICGLD